MCGICNLFRCVTGRRRNSCGCGSGTYENGCDRRTAWREPRMKIHCASGLGTETARPCGMDSEWTCGCNRYREREEERRRPCEFGRTRDFD